MAEYKKLKYYFDAELAVLLADKIKHYHAEFHKDGFVDRVAESVGDLELKARVEVITDALHEYLPGEYREAVSVLISILGPENTKDTGMFSEGYWLMPVAFFVEKFGVDEFDISVAAIYEITKRHTGEYAVRPFIEKNPDKMLEIMSVWSRDRNFHVRRLACEGLRTRLPWAKKLDMFVQNPEKILPVLENLKADESKYVQKSVANCLNDILKDNYETAMKVIRQWSKSDTTTTRWIVKHALRNELKKKNPEALKLVKK